MHLLRYLLAALIMYRHPREGRRRATCCGCGTATAKLTTWAVNAGPDTHEGWCRACYRDGGYTPGCTVATLGAHRNWDEYDAAALVAWPTRAPVPASLTAP